MVKAKVFLYAKAFEGNPKVTDFKLVEEELPPIKDGEFLTEAESLSLDPHMRDFAAMLPVGEPFTIGTQVAKIIESKNAAFPVGKYILGHFGWRTHSISKAQEKQDLLGDKPTLLQDFGKLPRSLALGILGYSGTTAYFALFEILKPKPGDVIVISGAAGSVGSAAGQMAKIAGAKVIGITGSKDKGEWIVKDLGFDHFINYKTEDVDKRLKELAPNGVNGYFDNVAGEISAIVIKNMATFGKIACSGVVGTNFAEEEPKSGLNEKALLSKQLTVRGFWVSQWEDKWPEGINQISKWIEEGKLKYQETVTKGFEKLPVALIDLLNGGNSGKAIVKV